MADNSIRKEVSRSKIVVEKVEVTEFSKEGTQSAQLRQVITTHSWYPSKQANDELNDDLFDNTEFGFEEQEFESVENRVAFLQVPTGVTLAQVQAKIDSLPEACLYKILSNHPIITSRQQWRINNGDLTKDQIANKQATRYGKNSDLEGQLVTDVLGKVQYRVTAFSSSKKEDVDRRTSDINDMYLTPEIAEELGITLTEETLEMEVPTASTAGTGQEV